MAALEEISDTRPVAELRRVTKRFGDVVAAEGLDLKIHQGEFLSLLGPSGCGKTTALRMLGGFEAPTEGEILLDGEVVNDLPAHRRPVNMVFQHYALFPHLDVGANIAYGLRQIRPRIDAAAIETRVARALETVRLQGYARRRIWELSGGQQQRVALARAIVNRPRLLLLDEPLAALDKKLRREMQIELLGLQRSLGITFVLVTHDQEEALSMSDRICIMQAGRIVQVGTPRELYDRPVNRYVADFVGKSNFFHGEVERTGGGIALVGAGGIRITQGGATGLAQGRKATACLRPEQIGLSRTTAPAPGTRAVPVEVVTRIFLGEHTEYLVRNVSLGDFLVLVPRLSEAAQGAFQTGETAVAHWSEGDVLILEDN